MKKIVIGIAGVCALSTVFLAACNGGTAYDKLNSLIAKTPSSVQLSVSVTLDGETLTGEYDTTATDGGYTVEYSYEKFNTFEETDGGYVVPDEIKSTFEGSIVVKDGKIVEQDGADADISFDQMTAAGLKFDAEYFKNEVSEDERFSADVTDPDAFLQGDVDCTAMKVEVRYNDEAIASLVISYTSSENAQVVIEYTFG